MPICRGRKGTMRILYSIRRCTASFPWLLKLSQPAPAANLDLEEEGWIESGGSDNPSILGSVGNSRLSS
jgi:hypothetical protein